MLNLGGDHSVAAGSIHGMLGTYKDDLKVIWVDAHADCMIDYSTDRNFHGMPVASLIGLNK